VAAWEIRNDVLKAHTVVPNVSGFGPSHHTRSMSAYFCKRRPGSPPRASTREHEVARVGSLRYYSLICTRCPLGAHVRLPCGSTAYLRVPCEATSYRTAAHGHIGNHTVISPGQCLIQYTSNLRILLGTSWHRPCSGLHSFKFIVVLGGSTVRPLP
jgi:hypothetical protein